MQVTLSKNEVKSKIKEFINNIWQELWNNEVKGRQLYSIQKQVGNGRSVFRNRKEDTIVSRIRIGHTRLNYSLFKIGKHDTGKCNYCDQAETIEHVLIKCLKYGKERLVLKRIVRKLGVVVFSMESLLGKQVEQVKIYSAIMKYLKAIGVDWRI